MGLAKSSHALHLFIAYQIADEQSRQPFLLLLRCPSLFNCKHAIHITSSKAHKISRALVTLSPLARDFLLPSTMIWKKRNLDTPPSVPCYCYPEEKIPGQSQGNSDK